MSLCAAPISEISCRIVAKKYFIRELVDFVGNNLMELWRSLKLESTDSEILRKF